MFCCANACTLPLIEPRPPAGLLLRWRLRFISGDLRLSMWTGYNRVLPFTPNARKICLTPACPHDDQSSSTDCWFDDLASRSRRRSEEHTSELQSLMRISYAVFCLKKKTYRKNKNSDEHS